MKYLILTFILFNGNVHSNVKNINNETITLGGGCFWCIEAIFEEVKGIEKVESGYMGGETKNPTYKQVTTGLTGHVEVVRVTYNINIISLTEILEMFWSVHDPTSLNRQGNDVGTQYRSAIFYYNEQQKELAVSLKRDLTREKVWQDPIVTEITAASTFYPAETYHQDYYALNAGKNPYCSYVITPKVEKFRKVFEEKLK